MQTMDELELYRKRCRLCASEHRLSINLFGNEGVALDLKCKISTYLSIDVSPEDELPKQVCYQCLYRIETFHNFKQTCVESEHTLKNWHLFYGGFSAQNNESEEGETNKAAESNGSSRISVESVAQPTSTSLSKIAESAINTKRKHQGQLEKKQASPNSGKVDVVSLRNGRNVVRISGDKQDQEENSEVSRILLNMSGVGTISVTKFEGSREQDQDGKGKEKAAAEVEKETEEDIVRSDDEDENGGFSGFDFEQSMNTETPEEMVKDEVFVGELVPSKYVEFEHLEVDENGQVAKSESKPDGNPLEYYKFMMVTLDSPKGPRYGCLKCNKTFSQKGYVKEHLKIHTGEKPFSCSVCGRRFRNNYMLKVHFRLHTGEKNFKCDVCGTMFTERGALVSHSRTHTGVKPFVCKFCGRSFTQNPALKRHVRIHTKEKPYVCDHCESSFADRGTWTNHMRIHTGERPFECTLCGKNFVQRTNLQAHIKTHTDERPFPCQVCDSSFRTKAHLVKHLSTIHRDVMKSVVTFMRDPKEKPPMNVMKTLCGINK